MSAEITPADLAALGLEAAALGEVEILAYPTSRVDDAWCPAVGLPEGVGAPGGFSASQPDTSLSSSSQRASCESSDLNERDELDVLTVRSSALEDVGVTAALAPDLSELHLWGHDEAAFRLILDGVAGEWPVGPPVAPEVVDAPITRARLSLRQSFRCVIATPDRLALVLLQHRPQDLRVQPIYPWADPPIDIWTEQPDSAAVVAMMQERAMHSDRWERTLIVGMLARLAVPEADSAGAWLHAMMSSAPDREGPPASPRRWFGQLSTHHRASIARRAVARGQVLAADLEDCRAALVPTNQRLASTWLDLCQRRDDLEGVRVLLRSAEPSEAEALEAVLREVDALGKASRFSWPPEIVVDHERLRRVALADPVAWWGSTIYTVQLL